MVSVLQVGALVLQYVEQITSEINITSDIKLVFNSSTSGMLMHKLLGHNNDSLFP